MNDPTRRGFIRAGVLAGACGLVGGRAFAAADHDSGKPEEISPVEDLMQEHGVLKRVMLIYTEAIRRLDAREELSPAPIADSAKIIQEFIHDYHEKSEEDHLFPRFRKAGKMVDLVDVLNAQHQAGRHLTATMLEYATPEGMRDTEGRRKLADSMRWFVRMYSPHEAREDTVLFPEFRRIVREDEYEELGEAFEKKEHKLFGENGFENFVNRVAGIEKTLGIYDLAQFTPHPPHT